MALNELISYAKSNGIQGDWNFKSVFIGLLSSRQSVCAEALDRFVDLRALGIRIVYEEFQKRPEGISPTQAVSIKLIREIGEEKVVLSSCLLQAAAVLLSIWKEDDGIAHKETRCSGSEMADSGSTGIYIKSLADMLLQSTDGKASDGGLASAKMVNLENDAVSVESVSSHLYIITPFLALNLNTNPIFVSHSGSCWQKLEVIQLPDALR